MIPYNGSNINKPICRKQRKRTVQCDYISARDTVINVIPGLFLAADLRQKFSLARKKSAGGPGSGSGNTGLIFSPVSYRMDCVRAAAAQ